MKLLRPTSFVSWFAAFAWAALGVYTLALVIGTHLPPGEVALGVGNDKTLHTTAYFGLAVLSAAACRITFGKFHRGTGLLLLGLLAGMGALDELTQPYFGRHCDLKDWQADVVGAAIGLVLVRIVLAVLDAYRAQRVAGAVQPTPQRG